MACIIVCDDCKIGSFLRHGIVTRNIDIDLAIMIKNTKLIKFNVVY